MEVPSLHLSNKIRVGRAGRGRITPPRIPFAGGEITIHTGISSADAKPAETEFSRRYDDRRGAVEVLRSAVHADTEELPHGYQYDGRPLIESWPTDTTPVPYDDRITEMRVTTLALARMGIADVTMTPRGLLVPDMYFETPETGPVGAEVTLNMAYDESDFQARMGRFIEYLNAFVAAHDNEFPFAMNLGFIEVPKANDHERVTRDVVAHARANGSRKGKHEFTGELAGFFSQYLIGDRGDAPPFSGGGVANERGIPDFYQTALRRIAEKRDMAVYSVAGRKNWLILAASADPLFSPDTFVRLFETDLELGQFDCVVATRPSDFVRFRRISAANR